MCVPRIGLGSAVCVRRAGYIDNVYSVTISWAEPFSRDTVGTWKDVSWRNCLRTGLSASCLGAPASTGSSFTAMCRDWVGGRGWRVVTRFTGGAGGRGWRGFTRFICCTWSCSTWNIGSFTRSPRSKLYLYCFWGDSNVVCCLKKKHFYIWQKFENVQSLWIIQ